MLETFSQNLTLKEAFETAEQMHKELVTMEFDGTICQKFKLLVNRFSSFFPLNTGVLLEAGTRVPAPVYSEHSTRLRRNEVSSRQILNQKPD